MKHEQGYTYVSLAESSPKNSKSNPKNKTGVKEYDGVGLKLIAHAAKQSIAAGNDGYLCFDAVSVNIKYYEKAYGATRVGGLATRMQIDERQARKMIDLYGED